MPSLLLEGKRDRLVAVKPAEVHFLQQLKKSHDSIVFQVFIRGLMCVMKVVRLYTADRTVAQLLTQRF